MLACDWFKNCHDNAAKVKLFFTKTPGKIFLLLSNIVAKTFIAM